MGKHVGVPLFFAQSYDYTNKPIKPINGINGATNVLQCYIYLFAFKFKNAKEHLFLSCKCIALLVCFVFVVGGEGVFFLVLNV